MGVGSALMGFFGLVWRILEGIRRVLHLVLLLVIFGFVLAALHTSIPNVPHSAALVIAPEGEDAPAGEHVEVLVAVGIPEVTAFSAHVALIEPDGLEHLYERGVHVFRVQLVRPVVVLSQPGNEIVVHRPA